MVNALVGFSLNGMLPFAPAALGSPRLTMLVLALGLAAAALMLVRFCTGTRGTFRPARGAGRRRARGMRQVRVRAVVRRAHIVTGRTVS